MHRTQLIGQTPIRHHHDPRAFAWELILHTHPGRFDQPKRRAPAEPDAPAPARPGLWQRLAARLRPKSGRAAKEDADKEPSASDFSRLGSDAATPYIRRIDATGENTKSGEGRDIAA